MAPGNETKHLIVGTAGHVDHGKTTLIKAMTGTNTDRLKEEQERGLTIDLGFASLRLPSGRQVGIVDVPGHERFLKNMLAGASGVDIALLVVAADEGVMPQTREHLEILELLETRQGVIALTKSDMVDEEWLDVVEEDLRESLKESFLRGAKIIRVSGVTGDGVEDIVRELDSLADKAEQKSVEGPFRLPIDRVFTMTGFGTVVTGTLVSGAMKLGDPVLVLPKRIESRIRQLQVHGKKLETAYAGSRVAVNLVGVEVAELERGDVLLPPGYLQATSMLDVSVNVLKESPRPLRNRTRIRLHIGTVEALGRVMILGGGEIAPGSKGFVQLRLETPVVAARGDRFVLRFYSPMRVLGGGVILDPIAGKHRAGEKGVVERLERKLKGDPADIVEDTLALHETGLTKDELARLTGLTAKEAEAVVKESMDSGRVVQISGRYLSKGAYDGLAARAKSILEAYHKANPMRPGMPKEELRHSLGSRMDQRAFQTVIAGMSASAVVVISEATVRLPEHKPTLNERQQRLAREIESEYKNAEANPPLSSEIEQRHGAEAREILALLIERGDLIRIQPDLQFHRETLENVEAALRTFLQTNGQITVAQFRDLINSSRKYVVPLLEYFDTRRVTRRMGDQRTLFQRS